MFSNEQFFDGKVFLRSYADAIECIKQSAQKQESTRRYETMMDVIIKKKTANQEAELKDMKEYKLFQYSNFIFKKYFPELDTYQGEYDGLKTLLVQGYEKLKEDSTKVQIDKSHE